MPWSNFRGYSHWQTVCWIPFSEACLKLRFAGDVLRNILLFVPLGWCVVHTQRYQRRHQLRRIVFAAALSLSVEFFQVFCHNRSPAMSDVCTNIVGAVLGPLLALRCQRFGERHLLLTRFPVKHRATCCEASTLRSHETAASCGASHSECVNGSTCLGDSGQEPRSAP